MVGISLDPRYHPLRTRFMRLRFYIGRFWMSAGLYIMPFEARANFGYNRSFLDSVQPAVSSYPLSKEKPDAV